MPSYLVLSESSISTLSTLDPTLLRSASDLTRELNETTEWRGLWANDIIKVINGHNLLASVHQHEYKARYSKKLELINQEKERKKVEKVLERIGRNVEQTVKETARVAADLAKAEKEAVKEAAKVKREAEKEAEKVVKDMEKAAEKAEREAARALERAEREAEKNIERAKKEAMKVAERAQRVAAKASERAEKEAAKAAEKAEKEAGKQMAKSEKEADKASEIKRARKATPKVNQTDRYMGKRGVDDYEVSESMDEKGPRRGKRAQIENTELAGPVTRKRRKLMH